MKMKKTMKNFRLSERTVGKLEKLCRVYGISQTEVIARAIELLHDAHKEDCLNRSTECLWQRNK